MVYHILLFGLLQMDHASHKFGEFFFKAEEVSSLGLTSSKNNFCCVILSKVNNAALGHNYRVDCAIVQK